MNVIHMEHVIATIQNLLTAAINGEDNSLLLAMVEDLKQALAEGRATTAPIVSTSAISVMMPTGNHQPLPHSQPSKIPASPLWSVPKPPRQIVQEEEELDLTPAPVLVANEVANPISVMALPSVESLFIEDYPAEVEESLVESATDSSVIIEEVVETVAVASADLRWAGGYTEPDNLVLPLTEEMIAEAVALETAPVEEAMEMDLMTAVAIEAAPEPKDLNEKMANRTKMINEVLINQQPELAEVLVEKRITDLRKAISINEKYQFISSLFRGDEDMFERTVKTINNFGILPEAEYWIQRELLIKMGWNDEDELVQRFISLVKRRFS